MAIFQETHSIRHFRTRPDDRPAQAQQEADSGLNVIHGPGEARWKKWARSSCRTGYLF